MSKIFSCITLNKCSGLLIMTIPCHVIQKVSCQTTFFKSCIEKKEESLSSLLITFKEAILTIRNFIYLNYIKVTKSYLFFLLTHSFTQNLYMQSLLFLYRYIPFYVEIINLANFFWLFYDNGKCPFENRTYFHSF